MLFFKIPIKSKFDIVFLNKFLCIQCNWSWSDNHDTGLCICFNNEGWTLKKYLFDHGSRDCHVVVLCFVVFCEFFYFFFSFLTMYIGMCYVLGRFLCLMQMKCEVKYSVNSSFLLFFSSLLFFIFCTFCFLICIWLTRRNIIGRGKRMIGMAAKSHCLHVLDLRKWH